jgi:hypothetical protein
MSNFRAIDRDTGFLLPPSIDEWLPEQPVDGGLRLGGGDTRSYALERTARAAGRGLLWSPTIRAAPIAGAPWRAESCHSSFAELKHGYDADSPASSRLMAFISA